MKEHLLPFYEERNRNVDMLVIHCSAYPADKVLFYLEQYKCSCHYIIEEDGNVIRVVDERYSAQHSGKGFWRGSDESINKRSIGIELCHPMLGQTAYRPEQIAALIRLVKEIMVRHQIPAVNVVGHSDVAPLRKPDPGSAFPWRQLAGEGIGLWFDKAQRLDEENTAKLLSVIGYDVRSDEAVRASAYAFCRRFLPKYVQIDENPQHLVDHILPDDFGFMREPDFTETLQVVAWVYK